MTGKWRGYNTGKECVNVEGIGVCLKEEWVDLTMLKGMRGGCVQNDIEVSNIMWVTYS